MIGWGIRPPYGQYSPKRANRKKRRIRHTATGDQALPKCRSRRCRLPVQSCWPRGPRLPGRATSHQAMGSTAAHRHRPSGHAMGTRAESWLGRRRRRKRGRRQQRPSWVWGQGEAAGRGGADNRVRARGGAGRTRGDSVMADAGPARATGASACAPGAPARQTPNNCPTAHGPIAPVDHAVPARAPSQSHRIHVTPRQPRHHHSLASSVTAPFAAAQNSPRRFFCSSFLLWSCG